VSSRSKLNAVVRKVSGLVSEEWAKKIPVFVHDYFRDVPARELSARSTQDLAHIAFSHFELGRGWKRGPRKLRVYNPDPHKDGWESEYTIVQLVTRNSPFLVDTVGMELNRQGYTINLTIHPLIHIRRGQSRQISDVAAFAAGSDDRLLESFIYMEIDREPDREKRAELSRSLNRVLDDTRMAVDDWKKMNGRLDGIIDELEGGGLPVLPDEASQATAFLRWLLDDNFILLGYRDYELVVEKGRESLLVMPGTGLGIRFGG